ncbi:TerD family protein [Streptomyces sp. NBC_01515]|uniref:TerD family protein n=1 Tax=Streptomyces sp. NBC_01515 TaxID=2903890 RepID=UPI0038702923
MAHFPDDHHPGHNTGPPEGTTRDAKERRHRPTHAIRHTRANTAPAPAPEWHVTVTWSPHPTCEIDIVAFILDDNEQATFDEDFIFYGTPESPAGGTIGAIQIGAPPAPADHHSPEPPWTPRQPNAPCSSRSSTAADPSDNPESIRPRPGYRARSPHCAAASAPPCAAHDTASR